MNHTSFDDHRKYSAQDTAHTKEHTRYEVIYVDLSLKGYQIMKSKSLTKLKFSPKFIRRLNDSRKVNSASLW
jgi:uncharacterized protein YtpQ (UPF0354 family)